ncbi:MAG: hypothetical protein SFV52_08745 [Saprospiraceae bacterium]|nr:hypothetical protein [Saprospiraceae bacterium]
MKYTLMLAILLTMTIARGQSAAIPVGGQVQIFEPLAVKGQKRPVEAPRPPAVPKNVVYWAIWIAVVTVIFLAMRALYLSGGTGLKVLAVALFLASVAGFSYVMLMVRFFDVGPGNLQPEQVALADFYQMGIRLGVETPYHQVLADDGFRIGIGAGENGVVIADYGENKGMVFALSMLDTIVVEEGDRASLSVLPENGPAAWTIETDDARSAGAERLQQIQIIFRDTHPWAVTIRFRHTGYPQATAAALQEMLMGSIDYYQNNHPE